VSNDAEKDLSAFLAALPAYKRKQFEQGLSSFTQEEWNQWIEWMAAAPEQFDELWQEYSRLLQRVPAKLREYRKRMMRENGRSLTEAILPGIPAGRPRKDALAKEAVELKLRMNVPQIATELNKRHGKDTTTPAAIAKLIKRYRARTKSNE
jgi:hypothetical protein